MVQGMTQSVFVVVDVVVFVDVVFRTIFSKISRKVKVDSLAELSSSHSSRFVLKNNYEKFLSIIYFIKCNRYIK